MADAKKPVTVKTWCQVSVAGSVRTLLPGDALPEGVAPSVLAHLKSLGIIG